MENKKPLEVIKNNRTAVIWMLLITVITALTVLILYQQQSQYDLSRKLDTQDKQIKSLEKDSNNKPTELPTDNTPGESNGKSVNLLDDIRACTDTEVEALFGGKTEVFKVDEVFIDPDLYIYIYTGNQDSSEINCYVDISESIFAQLDEGEEVSNFIYKGDSEILYSSDAENTVSETKIYKQKLNSNEPRELVFSADSFLASKGKTVVGGPDLMSFNYVTDKGILMYSIFWGCDTDECEDPDTMALVKKDIETLCSNNLIGTIFYDWGTKKITILEESNVCE